LLNSVYFAGWVSISLHLVILSGRCSGPILFPLARTKAYSTVFLNSLILPGHRYETIRRIASGVNPKIFFPVFWASRFIKCWIIKVISSFRWFKGGHVKGKTLILKKRSSLNRFSSINCSRSLLVAVIILTSMGMDVFVPTRWIIFSSRTLSSLTWTDKGISPISSRKRVPLWADSNLPILSLSAPV